ncbi:MAG: hypothetical protein IPJ69_13100 [Deltaproteobacteria bacterium]|nr:MAG: hypothetical protein IPJ69_13100 [Deltaproteobacteria bacterium]
MNTSPTNLPLTSNGILGVVNLKHLSLDQLLQDDPQSKALKDVYIDSRIESETLCAALGLLDRAEENITRREPQVDTSQWNWGSLELIPKTNLLDRGVCKCLQLALSQDDDSPLASECLDYLESIVSAYHVYEDPDLSDETICRSILEESKIAIKENDSILRFLRNAVLKHTLSDSDLYKRVSDIALRLNEIKRRLSTLINQITTPKESEAHLKITPPKVATEAKEQTKLNAAHQRNCADMKTQLNRIKSALEVVDTNLLTGIIEKLKSAPLAAAEVVSLHQQITPYLDTIKNIKKLEPILNRFQPYASERKVELIGESKEADQLAELHFQLKKPMEDISSQISQLEPLLRFKTDNELVAIGAPALEAPASTPSLAFWGNYPEIDKLRTDTDFIQAIVGPNAPGFIQLMGLPELLIFAPDHLLLTDTRYRSPGQSAPAIYLYSYTCHDGCYTHCRSRGCFYYQ